MSANGVATNGNHATTNGNHGAASDYSIPREAEKLFKQGILGNPKIKKDLPEDIEKYAAPIAFKGSAHPCIPINWRFAESASALVKLEGAIVNALLVKKYGLEPQKVEINTDHAQLFFMSPFLWTLNMSSGTSFKYSGFSDPATKKIAETYFPDFSHKNSGGSLSFSNFKTLTTNIYKTADNRYFHLHGSMNPDPSIESIGLSPSEPRAPCKTIEEGIKPYEEAMSQITSDDMQHRASEVYKQAGTICWTMDEFKNSEHGKANEHVGLFEIHNGAGGQKPSWWQSSPQTGPSRPLAGLKVLDMTRIIAAPAVTRGLAELGASVLRVTGPHLPDLSTLHPDLNWGKWNCHLDLRQEPNRQRLRELILEADVFVTGYRPGVMEKWGFGPEDVFALCAKRDRGIVVARENCYGWQGPWMNRSGWQQISDANCGVSYEFGRAMGVDEPVTPVYPNSDFCTGLAGAIGIMTALLRRGEKGGSYRVDIALNYYSQWLVNSVGTYPPEVWQKVWQVNGGKTFRHYHNMGYLLPAYYGMLQAPGAPGNVLFSKEFYEDRKAENLRELSKNGDEVTFNTVKPVLQFPDGTVQPGFHIGTRGNGMDAAKWPEDLSVQVIH